jgi:hypothetical protein
METIKQMVELKNVLSEISELRLKRYIQDLDEVYNKLNALVRDELDTSLEQFLVEYYELKKNS